MIASKNRSSLRVSKFGVWFAILSSACSPANCWPGDGFRVLPYLQNPAEDAITIKWFSETGIPGRVSVSGDHEIAVLDSEPELASSLSYNALQPEPDAPHPALPFAHRVRVEGLRSGTSYRYRVSQGAETHASTFRTAPASNQVIRLIAYSDSETEPESSTMPPVGWSASTGSNRPDNVSRYLENQTAGYRANLEIVSGRNPDLILIAGDLVETGGEQRDWDEFWRHNAGSYGSIASRIPVVAAIGNHENFAGPGGGYSAEGANFATNKFLTYFESSANNASDPKHQGRYHRLDYGPASIITLDSSDGLPHQTASDTNHNLAGSHAPDFNPGSQQYQWFESQLADAQAKSKFTIVQFHHTMNGSGPHSVPFGHESFSGQSGIAMQVLLPLMHRFGVDVVLSGHNEMFERSEVPGFETLPNGSTRDRRIQCFDVGVGGDGLREPSPVAVNPFRKFIAHHDEPEVWTDGRLQSGGMHYGHLEMNIAQDDSGCWELEMLPVHSFPITGDGAKVVSWERRVYSDRVVITE